MGSSVRLGAIFTLFATKFKREYGDVTIGVSPAIASAPNFDYDGKRYCPVLWKHSACIFPNCWESLRDQLATA